MNRGKNENSNFDLKVLRVTAPPTRIPVNKYAILGARGFSCAVSGFSQVLKSDRVSPLVSSAFGQTRGGPAADETKLPVAGEKKPLVPRVEWTRPELLSALNETLKGTIVLL